MTTGPLYSFSFEVTPPPPLPLEANWFVCMASPKVHHPTPCKKNNDPLSLPLQVTASLARDITKKAFFPLYLSCT